MATNRGTAEKLIKLALKNLPDSDIMKLSETLSLKMTGRKASVQTPSGILHYCTASSHACLNAVAGAYYNRNQAEDRGTADALQLIAEGFKNWLSKDIAASVVLSEDTKLLKNRGVWMANPIITNPDGSLVLVVNKFWLENMTRFVEYQKILEAFFNLDEGKRTHIVQKVLKGQDPEAFAYDDIRLTCLLIGWMQADLWQRMKQEMDQGSSAQTAYDKTFASMMLNPLQRQIYQSSLNSITNTIRRKKIILSGGIKSFSPLPDSLKLLIRRSQDKNWSLIQACNEGDPKSLKELLGLIKSADAHTNTMSESLRRLAYQTLPKSLNKLRALIKPDDADRISELVRRLNYLNLDRAQNRTALEAGLPSLLITYRKPHLDPSYRPPGYIASLIGRLASSGSEPGIKTLASLAAKDGFLAPFLLSISRDPSLKDEFRATVSELSFMTLRNSRPYEEVLSRQVMLWQKYPLSPAAAGGMGVWSQAPPLLQKKLFQVLSACEDPRARQKVQELKSALGKTTANLSPTDLWTEKVISRAAQWNQKAKTLEEIGQDVEARYHAYPQVFLGLLKEDAVVSPLLAAAQKTGMDPYFMTAVAFQEGYILFAETAEKAEPLSIKNYRFSSASPMGIDSFADYVQQMKRNGQLRSDFNAYEITNSKFCNEANHCVPFTRFKGPAAALEALTGLVRFKQAQFLKDAKSCGIDTARLSQADLEMWTYCYYNFRDPKAILKKYGIQWVWQDVGAEEKDLQNVKRVGATADWLRRLQLFKKS